MHQADAFEAALDVSVIVPTLNRPGPVERALTSLASQDIADSVEIIVVDNSSDANARALVERLAGRVRFPVRYISVTETGVANARNVGIAAACGDWIAFLDDDETATPNWLTELLRVGRACGADAVFGPVRARAEDERDLGPMARYFARRINRASRSEITDMAAHLGTNNSMFRRAACLSVAGPFETQLNEIGGEDSLFLRQLVLNGRRFFWSSQAEVTEWVPSRRLDWHYICRRRFLSGQIRTFVHTMATPRRWSGVLMWMSVGAVQAALAGSIAISAKPFMPRTAHRFAAIASGGLGKIFWMRRFRPKLYGANLVS